MPPPSAKGDAIASFWFRDGDSRDVYHSPSKGVPSPKIEWTSQEDSIINSLQAKYGNKWTKITNEMVTTTKIIRTRAQVSVRWGLLDSGLLDSDVAEDSGVEMAEDSIRDEAKRGKKAGKARAAPFKKKGGKKSKRAAADSDSLVPPLPPPLSVDSTIQPVSVTDAPKGFAEV